MASESGFVKNWQGGRSVIECNRHMLTSKQSADVTFLIGKDEEIVQAHRYVLISRSCVFDAMLCGPLAEKDDIKIPDVEADIFAEMLMFLYTDDATVTLGNATGLLYLAKKYAVGGLERLCLTFLEKSLTTENACLILEHAHMFDEKDLYDKAYKLVIQHGNICFSSGSFKYLSRDCFDDVMKSGDLIIRPKSAFEAAITWAETECCRQGREITPPNLRSILGDIVYRIPFTSMHKKFYVNNVVPRGILTDAENVKIMSFLLCPEEDPSPFIRPSAELIHFSPNDFALYDGHARFSRALTPLNGEVSFSGSHDVTLRSICLYGGGGGERYFSWCRIGRIGRHDIVGLKKVTLRSSAVISETFDIKRYRLDTPVAIRANTEYRMNVEMEHGSPVYVGHGMREIITSGQCTLRRMYYCVSMINMVYALEITSQ